MGRANGKLDRKAPDGAHADRTAALALKPHLPSAFPGRAHADWSKHLDDRAIADFDSVLKRLPKDATTLKARERVGAARRRPRSDPRPRRTAAPLSVTGAPSQKSPACGCRRRRRAGR